jgi:hypothetical protein
LSSGVSRFFQHYDRDGNRITEAAWQVLHAYDPFYFRVALSHVGEVEISTVLLPFDHALFRKADEPPMIFETMVFGGAIDQYQERYSTELEALTGHGRWVERVRELYPAEPVRHWTREDA